MTDSRPPVALWWILGSSLLLKYGILLWVGPIAPVLDEIEYLAVGESLARGEGFQYPNPRWNSLHAAPMYPWFMGLVHWFGGGAMASKAVQVVVGTALAGLVYLLGARWFGRRAGLWAAGVVAFYPTLVAFSHYNWGELNFLFFLTAALLMLFDAEGRIRGPRGLFLAGLLWGATALSRAVVVYLVPLLALWVVVFTWRQGAALRRAACLVLGFAAALTPWSAWIHQQYDGFLLVSSGPAKIWHDAYNVYPPSNEDLGVRQKGLNAELEPTARKRSRLKNPVRRSRQEQKRGLQFLRQNPGLCFQRFWVRQAQLLNPTSFLIRHLRLDHYRMGPDGRPRRDPEPAWLEEGLVWLTVASYAALTLLAVLGAATLPWSGVRVLWLIVVPYFFFLYGMTYAMSRYRLSVVPLAALAAGYFLAHRREAAPRLRRPATVVGAVVVLVAVGVGWSVYFDRLWTVP